MGVLKLFYGNSRLSHIDTELTVQVICLILFVTKLFFTLSFFHWGGEGSYIVGRVYILILTKKLYLVVVVLDAEKIMSCNLTTIMTN